MLRRFSMLFLSVLFVFPFVLSCQQEMIPGSSFESDASLPDVEFDAGGGTGDPGELPVGDYMDDAGVPPMPDAGGDEPNGGDGPIGGACQSTSDQIIINDPNAELFSKSGICRYNCFEDPDPDDCTSACIISETGLSDVCAVCYSEMAACGMESCLAPCVASLTSEECLECVDENCGADYAECAD